jgi:hypothetical protein
MTRRALAVLGAVLRVLRGMLLWALLAFLALFLLFVEFMVEPGGSAAPLRVPPHPTEGASPFPTPD